MAETATSNVEPAALRVESMGMSFLGTRALADVALSVASGEVRGLVGHNGSGKSTLVKVLAGQYQPDPGSLAEVGGEVLAWADPAASERLGLRFVHQQMGLIPTLSVTENVSIGSGYSGNAISRINWKRQHGRVAEELERLGHPLDPRTPVGELPAATRSAVGIARALFDRPGSPRPRVVVLDEVTASMPDQEVSRVLELVRALRLQSVGVLYVSHHLEEIMAVCETVTVLRDGQVVADESVAGLDQDRLADLVVGSSEWRDIARRPVCADRSSDPAGVLELADVGGAVIRGFTKTVRPGRILGVAGITGSGREELAHLLLGGAPRTGTVAIDGRMVPPGRPGAAIRMGMALVPAERLANAVIPNQNIRENLTISSMGRRRRMSRTRPEAEARAVKRWIDRLHIRGATVNGSILTLSGGNQQKIVLARSLHVDPKVLVLDEPTQAVDVGAIAEIHSVIREISATTTIIISSSDNYELASLCSDVVILHRGRVIAELNDAAVTEENIDRLTLSPSYGTFPVSTT
ncbi:ribose transport system ATP-binding protein [Marmoricola sp. URHA0025 HA25]